MFSVKNILIKSMFLRKQNLCVDILTESMYSIFNFLKRLQIWNILTQLSFIHNIGFLKNHSLLMNFLLAVNVYKFYYQYVWL